MIAGHWSDREKQIQRTFKDSSDFEVKTYNQDWGWSETHALIYKENKNTKHKGEINVFLLQVNFAFYIVYLELVNHCMDTCYLSSLQPSLQPPNCGL